VGIALDKKKIHLSKANQVTTDYEADAATENLSEQMAAVCGSVLDCIAESYACSEP
jgi:hypothetical protein